MAGVFDDESSSEKGDGPGLIIDGLTVEKKSSDDEEDDKVSIGEEKKQPDFDLEND